MDNQPKLHVLCNIISFNVVRLIQKKYMIHSYSWYYLEVTTNINVQIVKYSTKEMFKILNTVQLFAA